MICPYCDSLIDKNASSTCPNCGAPTGGTPRSEMPTLPLGVYKQPFESLEVLDTGLHFRTRFLWIATDEFVPYDEIDRIRFVPAGKELGFLCIRTRRDKELPMLAKAKQSLSDPTAIAFGSFFNESYRRIFLYLQAVCKTTNE